MIVKVPKFIRGVSNQTVLQYFRQEYNFYSYYATRECPMRIPALYYHHLHENGNFVLIIEDLRFVSVRTGDQVKGVGLKHAQEAVKQLAKFHASWWESPLLGELQWISSAQSGLAAYAPMFVNLWKNFVRENENSPASLFFLTLTPSLLYNSSLHHPIPTFSHQNTAKLSENIQALGDYLSEELKTFSDSKNHTGPRTLLHGDLRGDNMFVWDEGEADSFCAIDFQCVHAGNPAEDLAYFFGGSVPTDLLIAHDRDLLHLYHSTLLECGVQNYSFDALWDDYKVQLILNTVCPILNIQRRREGLKANPNAPLNPRVEQLLNCWFARATAVVDHHVSNAADALRAAWAHLHA